MRDKEVYNKAKKQFSNLINNKLVNNLRRIKDKLKKLTKTIVLIIHTFQTLIHKCNLLSVNFVNREFLFKIINTIKNVNVLQGLLTAKIAERPFSFGFIKII